MVHTFLIIDVIRNDKPVKMLRLDNVVTLCNVSQRLQVPIIVVRVPSLLNVPRGSDSVHLLPSSMQTIIWNVIS